MQQNNKTKQALRRRVSKNRPALVRAPIAQNLSSRQRGQQTIRYRECERIATVKGSTTFGIVLDIPCNPALSSSFPWLSGHGALYERYRVHKLLYRYKNLKGTSSDGNILMSFDYDTLDPAPSSAIAMTQQTHWVDGAPWRIFEMSIPSVKGDLFTRSGSVVSGDLKTYDFGRLFVAAEGCSDNSDHGYLEVEYDIELFEKQSSNGSIAPTCSVALYNKSENQTIGASYAVLSYDETVSDPFGIVNTSGVFTLPKGNWLITAEVSPMGERLSSITIRKNGSATTPSYVTYTTTMAPLVCSGLISSSGSDTIDVYCIGVDATSAVAADACRLILRPV